jgi:hypothetical protein
MLCVLALWILIFLIFITIGFVAIKLINFIDRNTEGNFNFTVDEYFFMGFLILSLITGILSIFIPIGYLSLIIITILVLALPIIYYKEAKIKFNEVFVNNNTFSKVNLILLLCLIFFFLSIVVNEISVFDTDLYHTQYIKWIRSYAVIPGLGNIHGRFAFNSMFFTISGLFTFEIKDTIIYPLNGLCFIILLIKLIYLFLNETKKENYWKSVLYIFLFLISIIILIPSLNSPSPDTICATLIIYTFLSVLSLIEKTRINAAHIVLLNLLVFISIVFKISSLLIVLLLIPLWRDDFVKRFSISVFTGLLILIPFIIRNYFLSGYLIYPYPEIDIFNVDWKIPIESAINEKFWIVSWARVPGKPYTEILSLKVFEWIRPWFGSKTDIVKLVLVGNILLVIQVVVAVIKRDLISISISLVILFNLCFWFINAPDPRFVYGFLIFGFSFSVACFFKIFKIVLSPGFLKFRNHIIIGLLVIIVICFGNYPIYTFRHPKLWFLSAPNGKGETETRQSNFTYKVSLSDTRCFNSDLPCAPYPLDNVFLRGKDLSEGFKVVKDSMNNNSKEILFDPADPDTYMSQPYTKAFPLVGKSVEILPPNLVGIRLDKSSPYDIWQNYTYYHSIINSIKANKEDTVILSVYCYMSSDFNGEDAYLHLIGDRGSINTSKYKKDNRGTWQKLKIVHSGETENYQQWLQFDMKDVKDFNQLTGYVLFAYPEMKIIKSKKAYN